MSSKNVVASPDVDTGATDDTGAGAGIDAGSESRVPVDNEGLASAIGVSEMETSGNGVTGSKHADTEAGGGDGGGVATISIWILAVAASTESESMSEQLLIVGLVGVAGGVVGGLEAPTRLIVDLPTTGSIVEVEIVAVVAMMMIIRDGLVRGNYNLLDAIKSVAWDAEGRLRIIERESSIYNGLSLGAEGSTSISVHGTLFVSSSYSSTPLSMAPKVVSS
ncbi:hypothetical protein EDD21DRAFT_354079 [Dissophora ornata]|nr:hypothetical protein EDD21DRAFT_354079 [Dissophora ornata]